jgi:PLP dependent protein
LRPGSAIPDSADVAAFSAARSRVLDAIADACHRVGRDPVEVTLVAVSKTVPADRLAAAVAAGLSILGENRVQEGEAKSPLISGVAWHLIGPLQSNKARRALEVFGTIQSVDSVDLARRLDRLAGEGIGIGARSATGVAPAVDAPGSGTDSASVAAPGPLARRDSAAAAPRPPVIYLQVNVDLDTAKAGFEPSDLEHSLGEILELANLRIEGLMTVGRLAATPGDARATFVCLRALSERLRGMFPTLGPGLSMGMSGDFAVAVEEGATLVRVGRALFGERPAGVAGR